MMERTHNINNEIVNQTCNNSGDLISMLRLYSEQNEAFLVGFQNAQRMKC